MFKPKSDMVKEILMSLKKKSPDQSESISEQDSESEGSESAGLEAAAEDIISAIKSSDAAGLVEALKAFIEQC